MQTGAAEPIVTEVTSTHSMRDAGAALVHKAHLNPGTAVRQTVRVVADGTGRTPAEVWTLFAAAMTVAASRATLHGVLRLVDFATETDVPATSRRVDPAGAVHG